MKFFLQKEVNAKEMAALVNFLYAMRQQPAVLGELLTMLLLHVESKQGTQILAAHHATMPRGI